MKYYNISKAYLIIFSFKNYDNENTISNIKLIIYFILKRVTYTIPNIKLIIYFILKWGTYFVWNIDTSTFTLRINWFDKIIKITLLSQP